jgi:hypothetical protein
MAGLVFSLQKLSADHTCWLLGGTSLVPKPTNSSEAQNIFPAPTGKWTVWQSLKALKPVPGNCILVCVCWQSGLRAQVQSLWIMKLPQLHLLQGKGELAPGRVYKHWDQKAQQTDSSATPHSQPMRISVLLRPHSLTHSVVTWGLEHKLPLGTQIKRLLFLIYLPLAV